MDKKEDNILYNIGSEDTSQTRQRKLSMLEALKKCLGIVSVAVEEAGIARALHYQWLDNDPEYKKAVDSIKEVKMDFIESKFYENVRDRDPASVLFGMRTLCKDRGYIEKQIIEQFHHNGDKYDETVEKARLELEDMIKQVKKPDEVKPDEYEIDE